MRVGFEVKLPITLEKEGNCFVARCPALDVCSQGENEQEATEHLKEALTLFLISCFERETLDKVLKESGFQLSSRELIEAEQPEEPGLNFLNVSVPLTVSSKPAEWHA